MRSLGSLVQTKRSLSPQDWSSASGSEAGSVGRMGVEVTASRGGLGWLQAAESSGESWAV